MQASKRLEHIERLEKKVKRRLMQGQTTEVIPDIRFIITQYRELRLLEKADLMEMILNQFISDSLHSHDDEPTELDDIELPEESKHQKLYSKKEKRESLSFLHRG